MASTLPPVLQASSGAIGSAVGNALVFPLDLVTTRMQHTKRKGKHLSLLKTLLLLHHKRGISKLYSGLPADTLSTLLSSFLYFYFYSSLHRIFLHRRAPPPIMTASPAGIGGMTVPVSSSSSSHPIALGVVEELLIGMIAGTVSKGLTLPISAICTRQQLHDESFLETLRKIRLKNMVSSLAMTVPLSLLPSLTLYIHSLLVRLLPRRMQNHPPGVATFLIGAVSNALATLPMYPLVLVKSLSQGGQESQGMMGGFDRILGEEGWTGLYTGIQGQLVKGVVQQGVMMLVKQRVEEAVVRAYRGRIKV
ncbi:hypothetical protein P7C73_g93, partial [Tremellales sp. Uapishka_1]